MDFGHPLKSEAQNPGHGFFDNLWPGHASALLNRSKGFGKRLGDGWFDSSPRGYQ